MYLTAVNKLHMITQHTRKGSHQYAVSYVDYADTLHDCTQVDI
jgi:hypothetical protein